MDEYRNKIKNTLEKVINGEKVFQEPQKSLGDKIREVGGAPKYIKNIFGHPEEVINESIESEIENLEKPALTASPQAKLREEDLELVPDKTAAPNVYKNWIQILPTLKRLGSVDEVGPNFIRLKFMGRDDEPNAITIHLFKHKDSDSRIFLKVSFDSDEDQTNTELALEYFKGLGLEISEATLVDKPEYVIFEVVV